MGESRQTERGWTRQKEKEQVRGERKGGKEITYKDREGEKGWERDYI